MAKLIDLTGQRFGRLTVVERGFPNQGGDATWSCRCDCGNVCCIRGSSLRRGHTQSCGCLRPDRTKETKTVHAQRNSRLYRIWLNMKNRCNNPHYHHYERYGGRGITICEQWITDFSAFQRWAFANGYADGLSIDRINNDKGYFPDNCRWTTAKEQSNNLSSNRLLTFGGVTKNVAQWCIIQKVNRNTVNSRLRRGWTIEEALGLVPRKK